MARSKANVVAPIAAQLVDEMARAIREVESLPPPGSRDLPQLFGVNPKGEFMISFESVLLRFIEIVCSAETPPRIFRYGSDIVMATRSGDGDPELVTLVAGSIVLPSAEGHLANLFVCESSTEKATTQYSVPAKALRVLLTAEPFLSRLPRIRLYARRPLFSRDFRLIGPGYDPTTGILVHCPPVDLNPTPTPTAGAPLGRLPPTLRTVLSGFCFHEPADLANFLGLLVTGVLANHFVDEPKAVALIDGNRPGLGKTLLARVLGIVVDGVDPHLTAYTTNDAELAKQICATLRGSQQSLVVLDNAKRAAGAAISSPVVESNSMAAEIVLRILGVSRNFVRPNDVLWLVTMNQTKVSADLLSRGLPIRLHHDAPPEDRKFRCPDPIGFAKANRFRLLSELIEMVVRWVERGRRPGSQTHRCHTWAGIVGGVLTENGFGEFLANYRDAAESFDDDIDRIAAFAEAVIADPAGPFIETTSEVSA